MSDSPFIYGPLTVFIAPSAEAEPPDDPTEVYDPESGWTLLFPTCPDAPPAD